MEYEDREIAGAARSAHVLHITPRTAGESARIVLGALGKTAAAEGLATVVAVPDRETAYALSAAIRSSGQILIPLTVPSRATRLLQRNPTAVVGTPNDLMALVRSAVLKLEHVRDVVLVWVDALLADDRQAGDLDTLLTETARDADRTLIVESSTPQVESFIERVALKPRRLTHDQQQALNTEPIDYLIVAAEQRAAVLQRLLDARDSSDVLVLADDPNAAAEATAALEALGITLPDEGRVAASTAGASASLIVWYGVPRAVAAGVTSGGPNDAKEVVALLTLAELARLRSLGMTLTPATLPQPMDEASRRRRALQDELSALMRQESLDAELMLLEPLLAQHDGAEIAAAAVRLLGRARKRDAGTPSQAAQATHTPTPSSEPAWTRLFLSVGERDGARRGDLVGAITGEADIKGSQIGKIEMRDSYSLVDVASPVADKVVQRLTGVSIRGRRVTARLDRSGAGGAPAGRFAASEGRRGGPRRERSDTTESGAASGPKAVREGEEWSARGERLRHARRPPAPGNEP